MKSEDSPIDLVLVTGFLGAGKTTFMNRLLKLRQGRRLGVLVNDFGNVPVDGVLIRSGHDDEPDLYEVSDGSIFCSCKTASFVLGLKMFTHRRPDLLLIEASGMSDPSGLTKVLRDNGLASEFRIRSIICVVDAVRVPKLRPNLPAIERQIVAADIVLINKTDLVDEEFLSDLESEIRELNPTAILQRTAYAEFPPAILDGPYRSDSRNSSGELVSCNTPATRPAALLLKPVGVSKERLDAFLKTRLERSYRIKGWVQLDDAWWYVSDNAGSLEWNHDEPPSGTGTGLTLICPPDEARGLADEWREFAG